MESITAAPVASSNEQQQPQQQQQQQDKVQKIKNNQNPFQKKNMQNKNNKLFSQKDYEAWTNPCNADFVNPSNPAQSVNLTAAFEKVSKYLCGCWVFISMYIPIEIFTHFPPFSLLFLFLFFFSLFLTVFSLSTDYFKCLDSQQ